MKYCDQCGRPLKDEADFCDFCGRECKSPSKRRKPSNKNYKLWKKSGFKRFTAVLAAAAICITCIAATVVFRHKDQLSPVKNAEEAITQLEKLGKEFGYENALSELTEKSTTTIDGDSYYRLQQNYKGIPVYGRTVVYAADEKGAPLSITGNVADVSVNIDMTPTVTQEQVENNLFSYVASVFKIEGDFDLTVEKLEDSSLCIYLTQEDGSWHLAYTFPVSIKNENNTYAYDAVVDAQKGEILQCYSTVYTEMVSVNYQETDNSFQDVEINRQKDDRGMIYYVLEDVKRNIRIYDANGETVNYEIYDVSNKLVTNLKLAHAEELQTIWLPKEKVAVPISYSEPPEFDIKALRLMSNLQTTYDFYKGVLHIDGVETSNLTTWIDGFYNNDDSTFCWGNGDYHMPDMMLSFGITDNLSLDTVAHEYTHAVERRRSQMAYQGESGAIMEALSDIFGELTELNAEGICDWKHNGGARDIICPGNSTEGYNRRHPTVYKGNDWWDTSNISYDHGGVHINSTVVSHAAYLMSESGNGNLRMNELARLWYRAMLMMPSDCDFAECRTLVELAGKSMNLSDSQIQCIQDAFDAVGIPDEEAVDYEINTDSTLCVYGADSDLYADYTIQIEGKRLTNEKIKDLNKEELGLPLYIVRFMKASFTGYSDSIEVSAAEAVKLILPAGTYTITLQDNMKTDRSYTFKVSVKSVGGLDNLDIYTDFGKVRLLRQADTYVNGILDSVTDFRYNEKGLITEVTNHYFGEKNSESCVTYVYDDENRMTESSEYKGSEKKWQKTSQYTYDDMGRLARYDYKAAPEWRGTTTYEYDAQGKLIRIKLESWKGNETAKQEILPDEDGHLVRHKVYNDNGKSYELYDEYRSEVIHDGEYEPFTIYELILVQTGERGNGVTATLEDVMGNEICSFPSYSADPELITDDEGYLVRINGEPRYAWDYEYTYLFLYDGDEALGRHPEGILDSGG